MSEWHMIPSAKRNDGLRSRNSSLRPGSSEWRRTLDLLFVSLFLPLVLGTGCASGPKLKPNQVGVDKMPGQAPAMRSLPDADRLLETVPTQEDQGYRVGPGDELAVVLWGRPDL